MGTNYRPGGIRKDGGDERATTERIRETDRPSDAIVRAVAAATDRGPLELSPLYRTIDAEAIDALFAHHSRTNGAEPVVQFDYEGVRVRVERECVAVSRVANGG